MKVYKSDYHCFACGAHGDIFTFIQDYLNLNFKETFTMLGGAYEKPSFSSKLAVYKVQQGKKMRKKEVEKLRRRRDLNNVLISIYRDYMNRSEPMSDTWCDCYNAPQYQLYLHEKLNEERAGN